MARKSDTYKSNYLKADQLKQSDGSYEELTLTISEVTDGSFDDGTRQRILSFEGDERQLGLNVTNWDAVALITGKDDDDDWAGFKIVLYVDETVKFKGKPCPAIRIKRPPKTDAAPRTQTRSAPAPADGPPGDGAPSDGPPGDGDGKAPSSEELCAKVRNKTDAWNVWMGQVPDQTKRTAGWNGAVAAVKQKSGKTHDSHFDVADWQAVAAIGCIPF